jgi:hypothetical protein
VSKNEGLPLLAVDIAGDYTMTMCAPDGMILVRLCDEDRERMDRLIAALERQQP